MNNHDSANDIAKQNKQKLSQGANIAWIGIIIGLLFISTVAYVAVTTGKDTTNTTVVTERDTPANDGNKIVSQIEQTIASVAEKTSPGVVSILVETKSSSRSIYQQYYAQGAGTGIIVSKDGYILTNRHVIDKSTSIKVTTSDGTTYDDVELLGYDPLNDLAFLKVKNVDNLKPLELGDSTTVRVGQQVIAIGNSLGQYQNTVTSGIISGKGRPVVAGSERTMNSDSLVDLLQTDAAINPGNSGGPLLNAAGQVIGINTAVAADAQGIGFAIPINAAKGMLKQVLEGKKPERAYLGVRYLSLSKANAKEFNLSISQGAYIYGEDEKDAVVEDSPADEAGIQSGDIITKVNDIEVGKAAGFSSIIAEYAPGDVVKMTIVRDGETLEKKVTFTSFSEKAKKQ